MADRKRLLIGGAVLGVMGVVVGVLGLLAASSAQDDKDQARSWYKRAVEWMDNNQPDDEELQRFRAETADLLAIDKEKSEISSLNNEIEHGPDEEDAELDEPSLAR